MNNRNIIINNIFFIIILYIYEQQGGLLIAKGSSSCVFRPNLKCKNKNTKINNNKVSKIVFGKKSKEYTNKENNINKIIKKIPGYKDWSLVFDTICKPDDFNKIKNMICPFMIVLMIKLWKHYPINQWMNRKKFMIMKVLC